MHENSKLKRKKAKPLIAPSVPTNYPPLESKPITKKKANNSQLPSPISNNSADDEFPPPPEDLQATESKPIFQDQSDKSIVNQNISHNCGILVDRTPPNCSEKKISKRYGKRLPYQQPSCQHLQITKSGCDKCCKRIAFNGTLISLHCGWHHEMLYCHRCKCGIETNYQIVRGLFTCEQCYEILKDDHGSKMITHHQ